MTHPNGHGKLERNPEWKEWWDKVDKAASTPEAQLKEIKELAHVIEYGSPKAPQHARRIRELVEEIT